MAWNTKQGIRSRDGSLLALEDASGNIVLESAMGQTQVASPESETRFEILVFSPNSRVLAALELNTSSSKWGNTIHVWDIDAAEGKAPHVRLRHSWLPPVGFGAQVFALAIAPDNATALVSSQDGVQFVNMTTGQTLRRFVPHFNEKWQKADCPDCICVSDDGTMLATWSLNEIKLWRLPSLKLQRTLSSSSPIGCSLAFSPDSATLIAIDREQSSLWSVYPNWWYFSVLVAMSAASIVLLAFRIPKSL
jgi:WD40 repeat protein